MPDRVDNDLAQLEKNKFDSMEEVRTCRFVIFRRRHGRVEYLLLQTSRESENWELLPQEYANSGESDIQAAFRITTEKTGLVEADLKIYDEFMKKENSPCIAIATCMLAELINNDKRLSAEYQNAKWATIEEVSKLAVCWRGQLLAFRLKDFDSYIKENLA